MLVAAEASSVLVWATTEPKEETRAATASKDCFAVGAMAFYKDQVVKGFNSPGVWLAFES